MSFTVSPCQHFFTFLDVTNTSDSSHKCRGPGVFPSEKGILWYSCYKKFLSPLWSVVTSLITRGCYVHAGLKTARSSEMPWKRIEELRGWERRRMGFWSCGLGVLAFGGTVSNIL